jgi:hypothetical protein
MLDLVAVMSAASKPVISDPTPRPKTLERSPSAMHEIEIPAGLSKAEQEKIRLGALNERIVEIARSVAVEVGDPRVIEAVEQALLDRELIQPKGRRNRQRKTRRYTVYLDLETANTLNAVAKEEQKNRFYLIRDLLRPMLGLPPLVSKET